MLRKISIKNFQSHKDTTLDLVPNINVICGKSTTGKTAIIRALQWLVTNRPLGNRFLSNFSDEDSSVRVELTLDDGHKITLEKDDHNTGYYIYDPTGKEQEAWPKVGTQVPDQITKLINMDDLNIQNQLDEHFLITSAPGEVARVMNRITKIERVDSWISTLTTEINGKGRDITLIEGQIKALQDDLAQYDSLDDLKKQIEEAQSFFDTISSLNHTIDEVERLMIQLQTIEESMAPLLEKIEIENTLQEVDLLCKEVSDKEVEIFTLSSFLELESDLHTKSTWLENIETLLIPVTSEYASYTFIDPKVQALDTMIKSAKISEENYEDAKKRLLSLLSDVRIFLKSVGKCPLCFSEIGDEKVASIIGAWE
jgi:exonuclease SbcC